MSERDVTRTLRTNLDAISVPADGWEVTRRRILDRRRRRRGRVAAVTSASLAMAAVAAGISFALSSSAGPSTGVASGSHHHGSGQNNQVPAVGINRIITRMASKPGFLVYLSGKHLAGLSISADRIVAGNSTWTATRNNQTTLAASKTGQVYWSPSVDPSHTRIVYVEGSAAQIGRFSGQGNLVISSIDGSGSHVVSNLNEDSDPLWSPNGKQIAFLRNGSIWLMSSSGKHQHLLGVDRQINTMAWAPDGRKLAAGIGNGPERIAIINVAKRTLRWFTPAGGVEQYQPSWSPNGKQLVYGQTGPNALFISNLDGTGTRQLTFCNPPKCTQDVEPVWSPDGAQIAFVRSVYGVQQIAVVLAKGGKVHYVTTGPDQHNLPTW